MNGLAWALLGCLALCYYHASAQDTSSVNAQNKFGLGDTLSNRTGTLFPAHLNLYGFPVPENYSNPDLLITLNSTTGGTGLSIYCNPGFGAFADPNGQYPSPGYAQWYSDLSTTVNQIFISKNDNYYKSPTANDSTQPFFICSVINNDANTTTNYTLVTQVVPSNRTLIQSEQTVLNSLYYRCCMAEGACGTWKAQNSGYVNANGGSVDTDFCSFPKQICSPSGNLYRLNFESFNLSCQWPGDLISQFTQLSTLSLGSNVNIMGNTSSVFQTIHNLTGLQFLDLSGNTGITGTLDSGTANDNVCSAVQGNLVALNLKGIGLSGNIPNCLYSQGSSLVALNLGSNNFTGSIQNTIPLNSSLQLFHVDYNRLTGFLPTSLANANNLVDIDTTMNSLTGTIPSGIGAIKTLQNFVVKMNNLSGPIPDSFGTALNLVIFDVKQNSLTALPNAWTNTSYNAINSSLFNIRASLNKIQSPFPAGLVNAQQLAYLILNENMLTGPLPSNNSLFPSLKALNVSFNRLTGSIPTAWGQSGVFSATPTYQTNGAVLQQVFDLSNNSLSGTLPTFLSTATVPVWTRNMIFLQGNNLTVSCQDPNFNYITSICPAGNASTVSTQRTTTANNTSSNTPAATAPTVLPGGDQQAPVFTAPAPQSTSQPARASDAAISTQSAQQEKSGDGGGGLSGGAVAGIVIGVLVAVALAVLAAFFVMRRRRGGAPSMPKLNGGVFNMPNMGDGEFGRKSSLRKGLTSLTSNNSGFERFNDDQQHVELSSPNNSISK